jgi:uncharacterized protein
MEWFHIVTLLLAGLGTGILIGLVGVGGGIIFAPVLLYYYQAVGFGPDAVAQLAVATSLFCVFLAATTTAWSQFRRRSADLRTAAVVGLASIIGVYLVAQFVTTRPWFDARIFQIILGTIIIVSVIRMLTPRKSSAAEPSIDPLSIPRISAPALSTAGVATGGLSAVAGVGGGIILVPVYSELFKYPIHLSTGTSSATIVITSFSGVVTYMLLGATPPGATALTVGTVDVMTGLLLALPAMLSSRFGVAAAHHLPRRVLVLIFVVIASLVSAKLLYDAFVA